MTPKEALKEIYNGMSNNVGFVKEFKNIEQALTELTELKRDVKRYFELIQKTNLEINQLYQNEYKKLYMKLSKAGEEE